MASNHPSRPPHPTHVPGTLKGEEMTMRKGREPGRSEEGDYRTARDATGINAHARRPIHPDSPNIPPA